MLVISSVIIVIPLPLFMTPSDNTKQQLLALFRTGQAANIALAEQLALATEIDLLVLLSPYQTLLQASLPSLELYAQLFSLPTYVAFNQQWQQLPDVIQDLQQFLIQDKNTILLLTTTINNSWF